MHGSHDGKDNTPVSPPGGSTVHSGRFLQGNGNIYQVSGIQHHIHGHVEHYIQNDNTGPVGQMQLCRLLCQRHHQNGKGNEHTADDKKVYETVKFALRLISSQCIAHQGMNGYRQYNGGHGNQKAVPQRAPEISHPHGLSEIIQTPGLWQRQDASNAVRHL